MNLLPENKKSESFRFELFTGKLSPSGSVSKVRAVGMAYLTNGNHSYYVKLYGALAERFVVVPTKESNEKYKIISKEEVERLGKTKRTYWHVVGDGNLLSASGVMRLYFDLYAKSIYMNLYPENLSNVIPFPSTVYEESEKEAA